MDYNEYKTHDREYFQKLWEHHRSDSMVHTAKVWDSRALEWAEELKTDTPFRRKLDERVEKTTAYLNSQDLLNSSADIIDIGSGSGRFTVEFAKYSNHVTGIDISPEMLDLGRKYAASEGISNTSFLECDFRHADIDDYGWRKQFDLVFSSMSPGAGNLAGLNKMNAMSRRYCFNCCPVGEEDNLKNRIESELFGTPKKHESLWSGRYFYSLFNLLWLDGYLPVTSYYTQEVNDREKVTDSLVSYYASHFERQLPKEKDLKQRIYDFLIKDADADGRIVKHSSRLYGWVLWNVNNKRS